MEVLIVCIHINFKCIILSKHLPNNISLRLSTDDRNFFARLISSWSQSRRVSTHSNSILNEKRLEAYSLRNLDIRIVGTVLLSQICSAIHGSGILKWGLRLLFRKITYFRILSEEGVPVIGEIIKGFVQMNTQIADLLSIYSYGHS